MRPRIDSFVLATLPVWLAVATTVCGLSGCGSSQGPEAEALPGELAAVEANSKRDESTAESGRKEEIGMGEPGADKLATATFGGGCFWCTEAVFRRLRGVASVAPGYMGGRTADPTYQEVCRGDSGHAEVIQLTYDPEQVGFEELLEVFWKTHDPTTLNRQGADVGTQYRSVVFCHSEEQSRLATQYKHKLDEAGVFDAPIVTEISTASVFYPAEGYHHNYFEMNPYQGYCQAVIRPKIDKLQRVFAERLKQPAAE